MQIAKTNEFYIADILVAVFTWCNLKTLSINLQHFHHYELKSFLIN